MWHIGIGVRARVQMGKKTTKIGQNTKETNIYIYRMHLDASKAG